MVDMNHLSICSSYVHWCVCLNMCVCEDACVCVCVCVCGMLVCSSPLQLTLSNHHVGYCQVS